MGIVYLLKSKKTVINCLLFVMTIRKAIVSFYFKQFLKWWMRQIILDRDSSRITRNIKIVL
jgi:hypothetical protein